VSDLRTLLEGEADAFEPSGQLWKRTQQHVRRRRRRRLAGQGAGGAAVVVLLVALVAVLPDDGPLTILDGGGEAWQEVSLGHAAVSVPADWRVVDVASDVEFRRLCGNEEPTLVRATINLAFDLCPTGDGAQPWEAPGFTVLLEKRTVGQAEWIVDGEPVMINGLHGFGYPPDADTPVYVFPDVHLVVRSPTGDDVVARVLSSLRTATSAPPVAQRAPFLAADTQQVLAVHQGEARVVHRVDGDDQYLAEPRLRPGSTRMDATIVVGQVAEVDAAGSQPLTFVHLAERTTSSWTTQESTHPGAPTATGLLHDSVWDPTGRYLATVDHPGPDRARLTVVGWTDAPGSRPPDFTAVIDDLRGGGNDGPFALAQWQWDDQPGQQPTGQLTGQLLLRSPDTTASIPVIREPDGTITLPPTPFVLG